MNMKTLTLDQVQTMLSKGHARSAGASIDPANRLYEKHLRAHKPRLLGDRPHLSTETVEVICERWSMKALIALLPKGPSGKVPRHETNDPIVVIRDRGVDSIIDGGRRVSTWHREGISGPHPVAILKVLQ